jgi:geranylgeranyl diphosphate synthase type II
MKQQQKLDREIEHVEQLLVKYLPEKDSYQERIIDAMEYSCMAGGKRLRPIMMQEAFLICGGKDASIEPFMAAIEMIHTYSLVHDDLPCMDNDEYRRGKKTTWSVYGDDFGVLCGDALLNYAFETATTAFEMSDEPLRVGRALRVLAQKSGVYGMLGGQAVDVWLTDKPMDAQQLDFIYRLKTGALIECSMMIGAILAGADDQTVARFETIAAKVGMAFQIRDDILDLTSTTEVLGKPVLSDEKNNKTTYVSLYGMEKAQKDVEQLMNEAEELLACLPGDTAFLHYIFEMLVNRKK